MEKAVKFRTLMKDSYRDHPSEDALERFLLNQSEEEELEIVETHFLACEACVSRLETLELNIAATKLALKTQLAEQAEKLAHSEEKKSWFSWLTVPRLSFAGGLAACALAITLVAVPRSVNLVAERGNESTVVSEWVPLNLHLQARDLTPGPVTVELVDAAGKQLWESAAAVKNEQIDVKAPRLMSAGSYLVQVYSPTANNPMGDLVREYSISAKPLW